MRSRQQELQALYERLPHVKCKQKCQAFCAGHLAMSLEEYDALCQAAGDTLPNSSLMRWGVAEVQAIPCCPLLKNGRCTAYSVRPFICRAWAAVEGLRCPHGCQPDGGYLSYREFLVLTLLTGAAGPLMTEQEARRMIAHLPAGTIEVFRQHQLRTGSIAPLYPASN